MTLGVTLQTLKILYVCHCVMFTWSLQQRDGRSGGHRPKDMPSPAGEDFIGKMTRSRTEKARGCYESVLAQQWKNLARSFTFVHVCGHGFGSGKLKLDLWFFPRISFPPRANYVGEFDWNGQEQWKDQFGLINVWSQKKTLIWNTVNLQVFIGVFMTFHHPYGRIQWCFFELGLRDDPMVVSVGQGGTNRLAWPCIVASSIVSHS